MENSSESGHQVGFFVGDNKSTYIKHLWMGQALECLLSFNLQNHPGRVMSFIILMDRAELSELSYWRDERKSTHPDSG